MRVAIFVLLPPCLWYSYCKRPSEPSTRSRSAKQSSSSLSESICKPSILSLSTCATDGLTATRTHSLTRSSALTTLYATLTIRFVRPSAKATADSDSALPSSVHKPESCLIPCGESTRTIRSPVRANEMPIYQLAHRTTVTPGAEEY